MPIRSLKHAAAACCVGLLATAPARATQILNFTYDGNNNGSPFIITGGMAGALALDGNTFVPTTWLSIKVNGTSVGTGIPGAAVNGAGGAFNQTPVAAVIKLDGSSENFANFPVFQNTDLIFQSSDVNSFATPVQINGFGGVAWVQSEWHASIDAPEPASLALFGVGAAVLGMVRRRRA